MHTLNRWLTVGALLCLGAPSSAQVFQLTREQSIRLDNPRIQPRLEWMLDEPAPIDKQSFRELQSLDIDPATVYVRFLPGVDAAERADAHARAGVAGVTWRSELVPGLVCVRVGERDVLGTIHAYLDDARTLYAEPSYRARLTNDPNDPEYGNQWGLFGGEPGLAGWGTYAQFAWDEWQGDQDFIVAVIDTGVELPLADLLPNQWTNWGELNGVAGVDDDDNGKVDDFYGWNVKDGTNDVTSCGNDHGTHVAGTIGARGDNGEGVVGLNWRCSIMALRCNGGPDPGDCDGLYNTPQALDYAAANGARVSNNSYGSYAYSQTAYEEILAAQTLGHIFVAAAGNDGISTDALPHYPSSYALSNIISVAAIEPDGDLAVQDTIFENSFDSNYGAQSVDLAAPGVQILSTVLGGYGEKNGSSMAAPHVTGAAALVWSKYPELTWWQVRERILGSTNANSTLAGKTVTGGTLNVHRALGVWAGQGVTGGGLLAGTAWNPLDYTNPLLFVLAAGMTPDWGSLNLTAGSMSHGAWDDAATVAGLGSRPMTIRAHGGMVRIGGS